MLPDRVIRNGRVEPERWRFLGLDESGAVEGPLPAGPLVLPLAWWRERRAELATRREPLGIWLRPGDDPGELASGLPSLALVAVHFPKFTDGRGYSVATLLRTRHGYRGELRAFGDVGRDQIFLLRRCGFDAFSLALHRDPEAALAGLSDFSVRYQGSVDDPAPLFRKRLGAREPGSIRMDPIPGGPAAIRYA